jgi:5S rRNA maturation endonuclease (ribonuclease M5)
MASLGGGHGEPPVELLSQLEMVILSRQGKREGRETRFLCPAHDDHHPSARWNPEKKTWVCDACGAGGGWADLSKRLGLELPGSRRSVTASYAYQDEEGRLLFEVVRYEPKDFRQRRPDGAVGWTYNLNGTRRVLYNLPRVLTAVAAGETVWLVEGEKDADNLTRLGLVATTNSGGAGKWRDEYSEVLRGAKVVILPDNDDPGRQHAQTVAQRLQGVAAEVRILELRGLPEKGDVSDWIREREEEDGKDHESTRATLEHLASTVPVFSARDSAPPIGTGGRAETEAFELSARDSAREGQPPVRGLGDGRKTTLFVTARETCSEVAEEVHWIVEPFLAAGCLTDLAGPAKAAGKTTLALVMIRAVLDGEEFLGRRTARSPVVFLTEQSRGTFRPALSRAHLTERDDLSILYAHKAATLSWPQIVASAVEECLRIGAQLLVVDTLPALSRLRGDAENSAGEALRVLEPLQQAAGEHGIAVLYTRHERKGGGPVGEAARGSSAFAGGADVLLSLRRPEGRYGHGVRYLQSLSRFQETPPELMIELGEDGQYFLVSDQAITMVEDEIRAGLLEVLPESADHALTLDELVQRCPKLTRTTAQRKLTELYTEGVIHHVGLGRRGDPKRYYLAAGGESEAPY